jgi:hypothetical protein
MAWKYTYKQTAILFMTAILAVLILLDKVLAISYDGKLSRPRPCYDVLVDMAMLNWCFALCSF